MSGFGTHEIIPAETAICLRFSCQSANARITVKPAAMALASLPMDWPERFAQVPANDLNKNTPGANTRQEFTRSRETLLESEFGCSLKDAWILHAGDSAKCCG
jgi:hypothetical protein